MTHYRICSKCIMDTSDPDITFDAKGICNYCREYDIRIKSELHSDDEGQKKLKSALDKIKEEGKNKDYDCLIGVSGGADSSMVAYHVKRLGLRPLAIRLDNGWDSETAVCNVERIVKKLDIPLDSYVLDWEEFRDLTLSFLKASVINSEVPTDHAINAILFRKASKLDIRYIITGSNIVTEATMPKSWGYTNQDWRHIKGIHNKFGKVKLRTFPKLTLFDWAYYIFVKRIRFIPILNYMNYNREETKAFLHSELGWKDYGGKHFESIYTRFFQAYILPKKFNVDKRKAHLSTMICSGQITREQALKEMESDPYPPELLDEDRTFVLKKFGLSNKDFEDIMSAPIRSFRDYPNNKSWFDKLQFFVQFARKRATYN